MNEFPRLSDETLEELLTAVVRAIDHRGLRIALPLEAVFTPEVLHQFPTPIDFGACSFNRQSLH